MPTQAGFKRLGIIYRATSPSGKVYVGKTIQTLEKRRYKHVRDAFKEKRPIYDSKFYRAIRKYRNNIVWEVLEEEVPEENLNLKEIHYIDTYNSFENGYNSTLGGNGGPIRLGMSNTEESKRKLSKSRRGIVFSQEHKENLRLSHLGNKPSKETREKLKQAHKGKILCQKTKDKISLAHKGKTLSKEHRKKIK